MTGVPPCRQSGDDDPTLRLADIVVVGGGCYGTFYAGQLEAARSRGKLEYGQLLVVDRNSHCRITGQLAPDSQRRVVVSDWGDFFDRYLVARTSVLPSVIVPSPLMPHLMFEWLVRRARERWPSRPVEVGPLETSPGTPYDALGQDGTRYISFADWLCPTHCVEPAICPVTRAPRTWEMWDALREVQAQRAATLPTAGPVLFQCQHLVHGVGAFTVQSVLEGDQEVARAGAGGAPVDILVGTISSCHGAVNLLHLG